MPPRSTSSTRRSATPRSRASKPAPAGARTPRLSLSDRHDLYQRAVQCTESEIDFVDATFRSIRGYRATRLREDFCGTFNTCCEWVRRRPANVAEGVDLDPDPLKWGEEHNLSKLSPDQRTRVHTRRANVLDAPSASITGQNAPQIVLAMNFSYMAFRARSDMLAYFTSVRRSLASDGVFFLDHYGGSDAQLECTERRRVARDGKRPGFTYIWDQHDYDPITGTLKAFIHFRLKSGKLLRRAFSYTWRVWTLPELQDVLKDAGFRSVKIYWEGDDGNGSGNGVFRPAKRGTPDQAYISYIVAIP